MLALKGPAQNMLTKKHPSQNMLTLKDPAQNMLTQKDPAQTPLQIMSLFCFQAHKCEARVLLHSFRISPVLLAFPHSSFLSDLDCDTTVLPITSIPPP